ncbi:hypothetical protein HU200_011483 [Digitaria exilis]|uniref:Uncharacterized protein n=1 Tax=Digitaria exilis TaxID=1010633 RepID=A0A835FGK3_9POAL|nr:hypothetical protein HU200_011483 [Digitaria exilis]
MAQSRSIVGALFVVTLILVAPSVLSGKVDDVASTLKGKVTNCNKECEGKVSPTDINLCKEGCTIFKKILDAAIGAAAYHKNCGKVKNGQLSLKLCRDKCRQGFQGLVRICRKSCSRYYLATST